MDPPPPKLAAKPKKPVAAWRRKVGLVVPWLLAAFFIGGLLQVFLAGYGLVEVGGKGMQLHLDFAHVIEILPLLIILFGFLGADHKAGIGGIVLFVMFQLQYVFISQTDPSLRALHPLNGVAMILVAFALFVRRLPWKMAPAKPLGT